MIIKKFQYKYFRTMSVAPETAVADTEFNTSSIMNAMDIANDNSVDLILFPELSVTSYSCGDLFFQSNLLDDVENRIEDIRNHSSKYDMVTIVGAPLRSNGRLFNCAVVINNGEIKGVIPKTHIVNSNEYYEERWFSSDVDRRFDHINIKGEDVPFGSNIIFRVKEFPECRIGIEICEDLWSVKPPSLDQALAGANILLNLSASNELLSKSDYRKELVKTQSARTLGAYIYSSCGPGESTTDVIFSGHCIISENGKILEETRNFDFDTHYIIGDIDIDQLYNARLKNNSYGFDMPDKDFKTIDVSIQDKETEKIFRKFIKNPFIPRSSDAGKELANEILELQSTAVAKRIKHIQSENVVIGISGGLDSTLALIATLKAFEKLNLDKKGIHGITLPGLGSSNRTKSNAVKLLEKLDLSVKNIDITNAVLGHFKDINHDPEDLSVVYENSQARERTQILMDYANKVNGIVVGTGDLSEIALGWSTYNADHMSMYNVNAGLPKTLIKFLLRELSEWEEYSGIKDIIIDIVDTPISPELLPGKDDKIQDTEAQIGPYDIHDLILYYFVKHSFNPKKIYFIIYNVFKDEYTPEELLKYLEIFYNRFFKNQFKRSCMPDGIKIGSVSLSPRGDWRMPSDAVGTVWMDEINQIKKDLNG